MPKCRGSKLNLRFATSGQIWWDQWVDEHGLKQFGGSNTYRLDTIDILIQQDRRWWNLVWPNSVSARSWIEEASVCSYQSSLTNAVSCSWITIIVICWTLPWLCWRSLERPCAANQEAPTITNHESGEIVSWDCCQSPYSWRHSGGRSLS